MHANLPVDKVVNLDFDSSATEAAGLENLDDEDGVAGAHQAVPFFVDGV